MWGLSLLYTKILPKCNTCILGHFESTHVGFKPSLYEDPTLNTIPAFWAISKVRMWGLSLFIRRSYPKCNTCILGHFESTYVGFKPYLYENPTLNAIPAFWAILKVCMWGLSLFIRRSYPKCNTYILGHTKNTHVGFKPLYTKILP